MVRPRAQWPSWQSGSKYKGIYKNTLILSCLKLKHSERFRAQQSLWTARWMSCGRGDPCFTVTPVTLERVTREPCSSDSNRSLEPPSQAKKKKELSHIAFHPVTDSKTVRLHFISTIALRCLIIILSHCLYFHCWGPLLCENCPLKIQPKNGISLGRILLLCVCACEGARDSVRADPNKRFSQKVQSCRVCKSGSHDWGWPRRPGPIP